MKLICTKCNKQFTYKIFDLHSNIICPNCLNEIKAVEIKGGKLLNLIAGLFAILIGIAVSKYVSSVIELPRILLFLITIIAAILPIAPLHKLVLYFLYRRMNK